MKNIIVTALLALSVPSALQAGEVVVGSFYDYSNDSPSVSLTYRTDPVWELWGRTQVGLSFGGRYDNDQDFFIGAGIASQTSLGERTFFEFDFMPGYYEHGPNGNPLGGPLSFWTQIGFGYRLTDTTSILVTYDHFSNAFIYDRNQGVDAFGVAFAVNF